MSYVTIEQAKKLIDNKDDPTIVTESIWRAHWHNARTANKEQLQNLLKNHIRLYNGEPSDNGFKCAADTSEQRINIIKFIENRLETEF
jgi:hypothetical protein